MSTTKRQKKTAAPVEDLNVEEVKRPISTPVKAANGTKVSKVPKSPKVKPDDIKRRIEEAREGNFYWRIEDTLSFNHQAVFGGALLRWKTHPGFKYYPESRLCGEDIEDIAKSHGIQLGKAVSSQDDDGYQEELQTYMNKRREIQNKIDASTKHLLETKSSLSTGSKKDTLADKERNTPQGKALNVSKIGGPYVYVVAKNSGKNVGVHGLRIVSDNEEGFEAALEQLFPSEAIRSKFMVAYRAQSELSKIKL